MYAGSNTGPAIPSPTVAPLAALPPAPQVCHLDCWEASGINDTQRGWLNPPYDISNSLSRLPLGFKVGHCAGLHLVALLGAVRPRL